MILTHEAPAPARHRVALAGLTPAQHALATQTLTHLGVAQGLVEDHPTETDPATRALITWAAATSLGLTVTPGHELAQCHGCRDVLDGAHVTETAGRLHCPTCRRHGR
jgi:hypothetical protein